MSNFEFNDPEPEPESMRYLPQPPQHTWMSTFSAVLAANLLTVVIVFFGFRIYVKYLIGDAIVNAFDKGGNR